MPATQVMEENTPQGTAEEPLQGDASRLRARDPLRVNGLELISVQRAHDLPGKIADAQRLRYRLLLRQTEIERRARRLEHEAATARSAGRDFCVRRIEGELGLLDEERLDTAAMLLEVERVLQRLRRERRTILFRLGYGVCQ